MTQSGVSQHIRKLEEQLDQALLIREGKSFCLTDAGERFYLAAKSVLESLNDLEQLVKEDNPYCGAVSIVSPGSPGLKLYPSLLTLQQQYRHLTIHYRFSPNRDVEQSMADGLADIGLMTTAPEHEMVSSTVLATEPLLLVTPAEMDVVSWEGLLALGVIDHPDGAYHVTRLLSQNIATFEHYAQIPVSGFSNQISLILEPVSRGLGFTVLPAHAVNAFSGSEKIKVHQLSQVVTETLYLCTNRRRPLSARVNTVLEEITRIMKSV